MFLLGIFDEALVGIELFVVTQLYKVAANVFKIFMILAQSDFLEQIDYGTLLSNFYVIIGLIMLFIMAFALLRGIINPDDQKQGTTVVKNVIINFVLSCVLLGFLPTIFPFMFDLQDSILRYNVIGGFFGYGRPGQKLSNSENVNEVESSSYRMVNGIFTAFFNVSNSFCDSVDSSSSNKFEELTNCQKELKVDPLEINGYEENDKDNFYEYAKHVDGTADFGVYAAFIEAASNNEVDFGFFMLLISGVLLIYVGVSYCFDMALRLIKLIFYQAIAPIPIFLRIIPNSKFSGTFNQWLKVTLTCWMEVFVRIFIFSFCMWLCRAMQSTNFLSSEVYEYGRLVGLLTKAFILMAIVMFMKRSPKLLSEVTGIDSGNMKLGIREKLADGGGFIAGAAVGGLATAGIRNTVGAVRRTREAYKEAAANNAGRWKKAGIIARGVGGGALSFIGGAGSGAFRSGRSAVGKKSFKDAGAAITSGANAATQAGERRRNYRAEHGGFFGAIGGHAKDAVHGVGGYFGIGANETKMGFYNTAAQTSDAINSASEGTYKNKKEYQDQSSIVKRLGAEYNEGISNRKRDIEELRMKMEEANNRGDIASAAAFSERMAKATEDLKAFTESSSVKLEFDKQTHVLEELRKDLSKSKTDILATAATRIGVDQKTNYVNDKELASSFKSAIVDAFHGAIDASGNISGISGNNLNIVNAMLSGKEIDKNWIDRDNLIFVQDAIDNINVGRQNVKGAKEREYIVASGNKQSSKDSK